MALLDQIKDAITSAFKESAQLSAPKMNNLETQNTQLKADLAKAQADLTTSENLREEKTNSFIAAQVTASNRITALETETAQLKADKLALEARLADPKSEINRRAGLKAAEIAAAQGGAPIAALPAENPAAPKPEAAGLKGHARIAAATKAQLDRDYPISAPSR